MPASNSNDIDLKDDYGLSQLHYAVSENNTQKVASLLAKNANINVRDSTGLSSVHYAASYGHIETLKLLIHNNALLNLQDNAGFSALHYATHQGHTQVAESLIHHKADLNLQDQKGRTALHYSVSSPSKEIFQLLIDSQARLELQDHTGLAPLHLAIYQGDLVATKILLAANANPNQQDSVGRTPLHYSVLNKEGSKEIIDLLLFHSACPDIQNLSGMNARMVSKAARSHKMEGEKYITGPFKELFDRKVLAHLFDIEGSSAIANSHLRPINYAGFHSRYFSHLIHKSLPKNSDHQQALSVVQDTLKFDSILYNASSAAILERLQKGRPTLLEIGFETHSIRLIIYPEINNKRKQHYRLAIANRGVLSRKPVESWTIEAKNLNKDIIEKMLGLGSLQKHEYADYMENEIWLPLQRTQSESDRKLESLCHLAPQTSPNCAWTSTVTAIWALLALQYEHTDHWKDRVDSLYTNIVHTVQKSALTKYQQKHKKIADYPKDFQLLEHISQHIQ